MEDIGFNALILALVASVYSTFAYFIGAKQDNPKLLKSARNGLYSVAGLMTAAVIVMLTGIFTHNFKMAYVADYTNTQMSFPYLLSAIWAGNDGSLLFWAWLISICAVIIASRKKGKSAELGAYASFVTMGVMVFFTIVLLSVANPFGTSSTVPIDGRGLNPLLENPGMIIHPPLLLMSYVVFTIPFAYAISALITGKLGNNWITVSRRWTLLGWLFLGAGNVVGAWWAYVELGWGGYWAWDPVENAGLMPWLLATAFLHSVMVQRRAGSMKMWNMVLIISVFTMIIFGTFITRSDVLSSVHTYSDQNIGTFFVIFLAIILVASILLVFYRSKELKSESEIESILSGQGSFLLVNILFVLSTIIIFIGTVFPGIMKAVSGTTMTVGPEFFDQVNGPLFSLIILFIGLCTLIGWRSTQARTVLKKLLWPGIGALLVSLLLTLFVFKSVLAFVVFALGSLVLFAVIYQWIMHVHSRHSTVHENYGRSFVSLFRNNKNRYGAYIVHLGIILLAIGVIGSSLFDTEKTQTLSVGDSMQINDYSLVYQGTNTYQSGYKTITQANLTLMKNGSDIGMIIPEKVYYSNYNQNVSEVDIHSTALEDVYVALASLNNDNSAVFQVKVNPLVIWIWIGGAVLVLGGIICFWPQKESGKESEADEKGRE